MYENDVDIVENSGRYEIYLFGELILSCSSQHEAEKIKSRLIHILEQREFDEEQIAQHINEINIQHIKSLSEISDFMKQRVLYNRPSMMHVRM